MKHMTLETIAAACKGRYCGPEEKKQTEIAGAVIDSRQVQPGYLFIPIRGEKVDGHKFIPSVFENGAAAVLSEIKLQDPDGPYILVESTPRALKDIAEYYRSVLTIPVVGIAGSVGKTSTKEMIASVLSRKFEVLKTEGNFNNEIGLPLTLLRIRDCHQAAVVEMGISDFGEMHRLAKMAKPDVCVMTNIGLCHLENLKSRDGILKAKSEMFDFLKKDGTIILNGNDDKLSEIGIVHGVTPIRYFTDDGTAKKAQEDYLVTGRDIQNLGLKGMRVSVEFPDETRTVNIPIPGAHNVYNALAGACVGLTLGLTKDEIVSGIEHAKTIQGRTNLLDVKDMIIIDDCYNANPVSMRASLDVLSLGNGRKIAVLGDMGELGTEERKLHGQVGAYAAEKGIDVLFCSGILSGEMAKEAQKGGLEVHYFKTRQELTKALLAYVKAGDQILVKASHFMEYPKVVEALVSQAEGEKVNDKDRKSET